MRVLRGPASHIGAEQGLTEREYDDLIDFRSPTATTIVSGPPCAGPRPSPGTPGSADDDLWAELHQHFSEPELVELGYFIGLTMGQQRFLKTLQVKHGDLGTDSLAGLAPEVARELADADPGLVS